MRGAQGNEDYLPWANDEFIRNPYPWLRKLQQDKPLYLMDDGTYILSRFDDIAKYLRLPSMSIVEPDWVPPTAWSALGDTVLGMDPPDHTQARRVFNRWFTPAKNKEWVEAAIAATHSALDSYQPGDVIDGHHTLAVVPTHAAMCKALQVPVSEPTEGPFPALSAMLTAMRSLSVCASKEDDERTAEAFQYLRSQVLKLIKYKEKHPGDGMVDALMELRNQGEMSEEQMIQSISLFWGSGPHNPSYLIGSALEHFARFPECFELYHQQPESRRAILNELIRLYPPELSVVRFPTEDIDIHGVTIPAKSRIRFLLNAANRDPDVFPNPDELIADRPPQTGQSLSFGAGPHTCAGQAISRAEAEAALSVFVERIEKIELADEPEFDATHRSRAYLSLPLRLTLVSS